VTADHTPPTPEPGADAGISDIQADIEQTRQHLGETIEALSAKTDVAGRAKEKVDDTKDAIAERASDTKDAIVEKTHAAQTTARHALTDTSGSVRAGLPIAAVIAATAVVVAGVVAWRRRR
jgi:ElaB/YqjD/DUF883 family membrane-anchored ribosome-binding protein